MDYGTGESDKPYEMTQSFVDLIAKGRGFSEYNYMSKVYDKDEHNEIAWSKRLHFPVEFLLGKTPDQKVSSGKIEKYEDFHSKYVTDRNVEVWLPDGYNKKKKYAVLYMHDGQMLFDSTTTWNKQSWNVDAVVAKLLMNNKIEDVIVVGIWNGGKTRHSDYFPQKPFESLSNEQKGFVNKQLQTPGNTTEAFKPVSDNYLKFLVNELKPFIDRKYSVFKDKKHTFIAGSSMGGLISMYAICEYPNIFGGAACMSTHWPGVFSMEGNPIPEAFMNYMSKNLPDPKNHKIYFDYGDKTLDAMYAPLQKKVDEVMKAKGFTDKNWMTKFYPGDDHSEKSWNRRLNIPLEFLLKK
jgi:predicted alpha/beta superfamily hydrolase